MTPKDKSLAPPATNEELLKELTAKIVEVVPEIKVVLQEMEGASLCKVRQICLEDVLRALCKPPLVYACDSTGAFLMWFKKGPYGEFRYIGELDTNWHFGKPLSDQPPGTIAFLHSLLLPSSL